ncbi:hypothetical protein PR048_031691 [Dryococelus australis]|uniref:Uncharacterized protein n=1 Tax=Dryococelus australis TaxID=614101 RepID=A0ABQ9GA20_9NEOP|nr:hypothetical protein PR048_031691 [Dryococelus australis]
MDGRQIIIDPGTRKLIRSRRTMKPSAYASGTMTSIDELSVFIVFVRIEDRAGLRDLLNLRVSGTNNVEHTRSFLRHCNQINYRRCGSAADAEQPVRRSDERGMVGMLRRDLQATQRVYRKQIAYPRNFKELYSTAGSGHLDINKIIDRVRRRDSTVSIVGSMLKSGAELNEHFAAVCPNHVQFSQKGVASHLCSSQWRNAANSSIYKHEHYLPHQLEVLACAIRRDLQKEKSTPWSPESSVPVEDKDNVWVRRGSAASALAQLLRRISPLTDICPSESRRATSCHYNSSHPVWHAIYECLQDIHGDSSPFLLQPFHELSNGSWPRLTSAHPTIQFVLKMFYRVEVGALGGPVQSANIVVDVSLQETATHTILRACEVRAVSNEATFAEQLTGNWSLPVKVIKAVQDKSPRLNALANTRIIGPGTMDLPSGYRRQLPLVNNCTAYVDSPTTLAALCERFKLNHLPVDIRCRLLEEASSYSTGSLRIRQHRHGSYVIRVQTGSSCRKALPLHWLPYKGELAPGSLLVGSGPLVAIGREVFSVDSLFTLPLAFHHFPVLSLLDTARKLLAIISATTLATQRTRPERFLLRLTITARFDHVCKQVLLWQLTFTQGAAVAERLARPPPTKANRAQSPARSPDSCKWESCRTMPVGRRVFSGISRFPRPFIPAPLHIHFNRPHRLSRPRC